MNEVIVAGTALPAAAEARVQDLALAERLGYRRTTDIRKLIKRHAPMLEAMGSLRQHAAMIVTGKGAKRSVTEYHLNRAQTAFIIAKAGTKIADSLAVMMAEVFALFSEGKIAPTSDDAEAELAAAAERERTRRRALYEEERDARSEAFKFLNQGRVRHKRRY